MNKLIAASLLLAGCLFAQTKDANVRQLVPSGTPANNDCPKWVLSGGVYTLGTSGAACGAGAGTVTSIIGGSGLTGGTITTTGTFALDTTYLNANWLPLTGGTMSGKLIAGPSATTAGLNLPPTSLASWVPVAGDEVMDASGHYAGFTGTVVTGFAYFAGSSSALALPSAGVVHVAGSTLAQTSSLIVAADITAATITAAKMAPTTFDAQTDAATITWAIASVLNAQATVTLGGNRTLNISNPVVGGNYVFKITQDGTGSRTLTKGTGCTFKELGSSAATFGLSTAANTVDVLTFTFDGTNCYATVGKDYK